jgi:hypothetical protein
MSAFFTHFSCEIYLGEDFAFPTQTVYLAGDASRTLAVGIQREAQVSG